MRIAITGALGHIGSHLIHRINPGQFEDVLLIDNLSTQRYCSLFELPDGVPFRFVESDIRTAALPELFEKVDVVIHLAAVTDAEQSVNAAEEVRLVNLDGTHRVADACASVGAKLIFLSTTSVYGPQSDVVDEYLPDEQMLPQSPYAESKLEAERLLRRLGEESRLEYVTCRFGTIFGVSRGIRFHTAINKFVWLAATGRPLSVWRTALKQVRPYLDIEDSTRSLLFFVENHIFDRSVYNVVTVNTSVEEVVGLLKRHFEDLEIEMVDSPIMNQLSYHVSTERIVDAGFRFAGDMEKGVSETVRLLGNVRP